MAHFKNIVKSGFQDSGDCWRYIGPHFRGLHWKSKKIATNTQHFITKGQARTITEQEMEEDGTRL